jgi:hypothetical protein
MFEKKTSSSKKVYNLKSLGEKQNISMHGNTLKTLSNIKVLLKLFKI